MKVGMEKLGLSVIEKAFSSKSSSIFVYVNICLGHIRAKHIEREREESVEFRKQMVLELESVYFLVLYLPRCL